MLDTILAFVPIVYSGPNQVSLFHKSEKSKIIVLRNATK